jgi:hypothetical protein
MDAILNQLSDEFMPMAGAKGLRLSLRPCDAVVLSDATYLRRILQNLIGNAVRYAETGRVLVAARRRGKVLRLEVWDTGPGIAQEEHENIFKEFHRIAARASASEGLGLGLAIVERAAALLGHSLTLCSRVGQGTVFMLELPITDPAPLAPPEPAPEFAQTLQAGSLEDRIVLLVENDAELRRALVLLLEKWGAAVIEAATGEEALLLIDDLGILPDALIVDQQLGGGLTGLQTIAALRARGDAMPARLISADRSESLRDLARQANVVLLIKPVQTAALRLFLTQRDTTKEA